MNIKFKDTSNSTRQAKIKPMASTPFSYPLESSFNNYNKERPLKENSQNLSFEGLSLLYKDSPKYDVEKILKTAREHLGPSVEGLFEDLKKPDSLAKKLVSVNGNEITFHKKTVPHLIYDGIVYPLKILPADMLNGAVGLLRKIKPLKNWADRIYNKPFFKNIRQRSKVDSKINAMRGIFETIEGFKEGDDISSKLFQQSIKMFDTKTGNYDTKHERSLNRIVSGSIPAIFLATDAYNLSSMCTNNKNEAEKEKKTRFRQELSRVGLQAYLTLITMGAVQKKINNSKAGIMLMTGITVLCTEMFSRLINGKHIVRLTPEQAKAINAKEKADKSENNDYKPLFFKSKSEKSLTPINKEKTTGFKGTSQDTDGEQKRQKPLLSLNTVLKASAVVIAAGFSIKGLRKFETVNKAFEFVMNPFKNTYKKLTVNPDHKIERVKFDEILDVLDKNGFSALAKKYKSIAEGLTQNGYVKLGEKDRKIKPLVNFVIAPFKFIYSTIKLPYTLSEKFVAMFAKKAKPKGASTIQTEAEVIAAKNLMDKLNKEALSKSIENIGMEALKPETKLNPEGFKSFVNDNILKSFNFDNMSGVSNSELANLAKTSATAATIWFLLADNYNMVMLKSDGEDKEGAELKAKERLVQEGSRLFYQTLLIDLFNTTFRTQYNSSLFGMSWITASNTLLGEIMNRKSVGMPVTPHSKDELMQIEKQKEEATGFIKSYYDFMARLTGKKSLAEQHKMTEAKKAK